MNLLANIFFAITLLALLPDLSRAQKSESPRSPSRLRGSVTPERAWWDLKHYDLSVEFDPISKTIEGTNVISFEATAPSRIMQIDLQQPLSINQVRFQGKKLSFEREGDVYWVKFEQRLPVGSSNKIQIEFSGKPTEAKNPPWQGGVTWTKDEKGNDFIVTTCQGIGASIWWPCKDHGYDEPDNGVDIRITAPKNLVAVSNGRLIETINHASDKTTYHWRVTLPINNYCINANIGNYVRFQDRYAGEFGELDLDFWVLDHQRNAAEKQFKEVPRMLAAFEYWFGKYPFYEDSYKVVSVPYPGMEHQSSVTYGNKFKNGYVGRDLSDTGVGFKFDFIIVHESGHEWFGNNISMKDSADMWIHEGFTNYSENLFVEYHFSKKEAQDYVIGCRDLVKNDRPIIPKYGKHQIGSGDMYYKAGNMLHTIRHIIDDDELWRKILRGLNSNFRLCTVSTQQIEDYICQEAKIDFSKFFDQYLRDTRIPVLNCLVDGNQVVYWYSDIVDGFSYPARIQINGTPIRLNPTAKKQIHKSESAIRNLTLDPNFYYNIKNSKSEID